MDLVDIDKVLDDLELNESRNDSNDVSSAVSAVQDEKILAAPTAIATTTTGDIQSLTKSAVNIKNKSSSPEAVITQQCSDINSIINNKSINVLGNQQQQQQHHHKNNDNSCLSSVSVIPTSSGINNDEIDYNNQKLHKFYNYDENNLLLQNNSSFEEIYDDTIAPNTTTTITSLSSSSIINNKNDNDERLLKNTNNKKFVTVSNVFSSLDDYRRDIESLQQQQQQHNIENLLSSTSSSHHFTNTVLQSLIKDDIDAKLDEIDKTISNVTIDNENDKLSITSTTMKQQHQQHQQHQQQEQQQQEQQQQQQQHTNEDDDNNTEDEREDIGGDYTTSSSSITTSSPSSFSSGPSPGSPSLDESGSFVLGGGGGTGDGQQQQQHQQKSDKRVSYNINDKNDELISNKKIISSNDENILKNEDKIMQQNSEDNDDEDDVKMQIKQKQQQQQMNENSNNKESLEFGLSSISSSYLYCEENIISSSSLPCSSQDMKFDALSSISASPNNITPTSITTTTTQNRNNENFDDNNDNLNKRNDNDDGNSDENQQQSYAPSMNYLSQENKQQQLQQEGQQQQKVVGFGSTMDEISDTELDSILQEIDNDFQMYYAAPPPSSSSQQQQQQTSSQSGTSAVPTTTNNNGDCTSNGDEKSGTGTTTVSKAPLSSMKSSDDKEIGKEAKQVDEDNSLSSNVEKVNLPSSKNSENDQDDLIEGVGDDGSSSQQYPQTTTSIDDENNLQNADSFSQASTIEFAELRLQTDFDAEDERNMMNAGAGGSTAAAAAAVAAAANVSNNNVGDQQAIESPSVTLSLHEIDNDFSGKNLKNPSNGDEEQQKGKDNVNSGNDNDVVMRSTSTTSVREEGDGSERPIVSQTQQQKQQQQLQRPNSLDLPTQIDVKMYINSTAGQTPPASRLDDISLLSTSSSDDQQLSSSEIGITSPSNQQKQITASSSHHQQQDNNLLSSNKQQLGKIPPFWIPDSEAPACMQCKQKFSLIKRRHHCRACGQVLCSVCCSQKAKLEFHGNQEARICIQCSLILNERKENEQSVNVTGAAGSSSVNGDNITTSNQSHRSPNPNNPMEYCSMISPYQQVGQQTPSSPISVMVPVGVLKREGAPKSSRKDKNVIFSDGIRPGCDLTELDNSWDTTASATTNSNNKKNNGNTSTNGSSGVGDNVSDINSNTGSGSTSGKQQQQTGGNDSKKIQTSLAKQTNQRNTMIRNQKSITTSVTATTTASTSSISDNNESYIPKEQNNLPPICLAANKTEYELKDVQNNAQLIERLQNEILKFIIQRNFFIYVKIVKLKCCVNKTIINFTTNGMHHVGQDEIIILLEYDNSNKLPKDIFIHLNEIYIDADHGYPINELGFSMPKQTNFLESREHGGFLYIRPTFQCLQEIYLPESPYLIGILIHRWEVPWAKIFPLRLMLRLGAEYRYYPSPHISIRGRNSVYAEIAQTIINFLADFRNYSYTLATIRGMYIHMEDRRTNILIPKNRYDQIIKALNNSSDHILALGANFSKKADGHLVCIQNMEANCPETHTYSTQAINIQGQARKVTGASFIVFNGALKTTSGLTGKCNIVEDGLMVQILPAKMQSVRNSLKNMKDIDIVCGPNDVDESQSEIVSIKWISNDIEFNIGVKSPIDGKKMDGIPSIRVHLGLNYSNKNHIIRWSEVFIVQYDEESARSKDPIDISKISEQIAKNTSIALVSFLDLLAANECLKIGLRATLHQENVCYEAGSKNSKLPPLYMNALDNKLIPILHKQATSLDIDTPVILELIFHILNK